jgi:hypothetical protein
MATPRLEGVLVVAAATAVPFRPVLWRRQSSDVNLHSGCQAGSENYPSGLDRIHFVVVVRRVLAVAAIRAGHLSGQLVSFALCVEVVQNVFTSPGTRWLSERPTKP